MKRMKKHWKKIIFLVLCILLIIYALSYAISPWIEISRSKHPCKPCEMGFTCKNSIISEECLEEDYYCIVRTRRFSIPLEYLQRLGDPAGFQIYLEDSDAKRRAVAENKVDWKKIFPFLYRGETVIVLTNNEERIKNYFLEHIGWCWWAHKVVSVKDFY